MIHLRQITLIILSGITMMSQWAYASDITLEQAQIAIQAATAKAKELNTKMDICVVDTGSNLKAFVRMDSAWIGSIDIAIKKARTASLFETNTGEIGQLSQPGKPLYNIEHSNGGLITFPGGVLIKTKAGEITTVPLQTFNRPRSLAQ